MIRKFVQQRLAPITESVRQPSSIKGRVRAALIGLWRTRGGGLYGLGYVVCFLGLEARALAGDIVEATTSTGAFAAELLSAVFRFGVESFVNMGLAFAWPGFLIDAVGGWGVAVLVGGFIVFERIARPWVERLIPELVVEAEKSERQIKREAKKEAKHAQKLQAKQAKRSQKEAKKAAKINKQKS